MARKKENAVAGRTKLRQSRRAGDAAVGAARLWGRQLLRTLLGLALRRTRRRLRWAAVFELLQTHQRIDRALLAGVACVHVEKSFGGGNR